jgi:hypothetical protein
MRDNRTNRSRQQANLPPERRPAGNQTGNRGQASQEPQRGPGQPSTSLKKKRPSGEGGR